MDSSIVVPITLWNSSQPTFRISCLSVTPDFRKLITGSHDGQLFLWNLDVERKEIVAKALLLGHEHSVTCVVCTNEFFISTCEGGEMCRWNVEDGYCEKERRLPKNSYVHRYVQLLKRTPSQHELLFACGEYAGILVYHSVTLQLICKLFSKTDYNWISNFNSFFQTDKEEITVLGVSGATNCIKKCLLNDEVIFSEQEVTETNLPVDNVVDIKFNQSQSMALIVTKHSWLLLDSELGKVLYEFRCANGEQLLGGNFSHSDVVIWTISGKFYMYKEINNQYHLKGVQKSDSKTINVFKSAVTLAKCDVNGNFYFIKGDHKGRITIWSLNDSSEGSGVETVHHLISVKIGDEWIKPERGFFDSIVKFTSVTCCSYVSILDKFFLGCLNGKIFIVPAMETFMCVYMYSLNEVPLHDVLLGHRGKVNCLLYPHEKYSHHDKNHLVSGASDFSVCLWHIEKSVLLHRFCVQAGEIQRLLIPPDNFTTHVKHSVCSVSSDHSVAVLNLIDKRCIILTSRHAYPVVSVRWKPLDGFMLVECFDGTVFVWEIETGFLDRVFDGVYAQEVLYACEEHTPAGFSSLLCNFYIFERAIRNSMKSYLFPVESGHQWSQFPIAVNGFRTSDTSQCQIWVCNLERLIKKIISGNEIEQDGLSGEKLYYLTRASGPEATKKSFLYFDKIQQAEKTSCHAEVKGFGEESGTRAKEIRHSLGGMESVIKFLVSSLHIWGLDSDMDNWVTKRLGFFKPHIIPSFGIVSSSGTYTLFLPSRENCKTLNSSLMASICVTMMTLSWILQSVSFRSLNHVDDEIEDGEDVNPWEKVYRFYEHLCSNEPRVVPRPKLEVLAKIWGSKCLPLRRIIQKLLPSHLEALVQKDYVDLLKFWYDYLPHFKACRRTFEKSDVDHTDLKKIALVLFGTVGSDLKFKANYLTCQENYIYQTCSSLVYLLLMPNPEDPVLKDLQTMAIDFIGRGYIVWEQFLKVEKIYPILFQMCQNMLKKRFGGLSQELEKSYAAHDALKAIALSKTSAFIKCIVAEIGQPNGTQCRLEGFSIENSKPEMLSIVVFLLEKTPYIMRLHLNEVISICVYCIDPSHLKQENLADLLPVMNKFCQVDHSVTSQRIAVGLDTGSIVLYDLRTGRTVTIEGHNNSIAAVRFSEDGKYLATYSNCENRLSFWQILTGMFGLGQVQLKRHKSYVTSVPLDLKNKESLKEALDTEFPPTNTIFFNNNFVFQSLLQR